MAWDSTLSFLSPPRKGGYAAKSIYTRCNSAGPRQNGLIIPQSWMTGRCLAAPDKAGAAP